MRVHRTIAWLICATATWSSACTITGLRHEVTFEPGSATLQASEVLSLTNWYVNLRENPGIDFILVHAYSRKGDVASIHLTRTRADSVAKLARTLVASDPVSVSMFVKEVETSRPETYREVAVSINPKCARTNTCCPQPNAR